MKKHLHVLLAFAFLIFSASAAISQVRFGARAGFNAAKVNYRVFPGISPKMYGTFQVGGMVELPLPMDFLYVELGLEAQGKGYQYVTDSSTYKLSATVNPIYVQIPAKLVVRNTDGGVYGGIGTYLAYGVAGKVKEAVETKSDGKTVNTDGSVQFGTTDQDHFRPFDFGATIELGYEFNHGIRISGSYSWGLGDSRKEAIKGTKFIAPVNHRVASLCISYFFYEYKR